MKRLFINIILGFFIILFIESCYLTRTSHGGGELTEFDARMINIEDIALPANYKIEVVSKGLTFPSGVAFDDKGQVYALESGYSYGEVFKEPRLLRIDERGNTTVVAKGKKNGPWTGISYYKGSFYVAEGGTMEGGKILRISKEGKIKVIVDSLPSYGDHHTNGPVIKDDYIYFGQGTATNSGVVGNDNADYGWLTRKSDFHDIPCADVILNGENFMEPNALTDNFKDKTITGAFSPYNTPTTPGQLIKGKIPCNGAIMRVPVNGGDVELVAWGFRNPFGLAYSPDDKLYITENGFDERGNRPVWGAADVLWEVRDGSWYGWPDYSAGKKITYSEEFTVPGGRELKPLLRSHPNQRIIAQANTNNPSNAGSINDANNEQASYEIPQPAATLGVHSAASGIDFSKNAAFGYEGHAFIAEFGDMAPEVGKVLSPVGFKVVTVDVKNGFVEDFATNKGKRNGPASWQKSGGLERPVDVQFNPSGNALYVVDFGVMLMSKKGPQPIEGTGVIWKITRK